MTASLRDRGDRGFTLVETSVVMLVLAIVLGVVFGAVLIAQRDMVQVGAAQDAVAQARLGLAQIDRQVRSGNVLYNPEEEPLPLSMRIYTQANGDQKCVQWRIDESHNLQTRSWAPVVLNEPPAHSAWRTVATGIVNDAAVEAQAPFRLHGGGSDNDYGARVLDVNLFVNPGTSARVKTVNVTTSLTGRNTHYGFNADRCGTS